MILGISARIGHSSNDFIWFHEYGQPELKIQFSGIEVRNSVQHQESFMKLELLQLSQDGTLSPVTGALFPSLPSPRVDVIDFKIVNLRKCSKEEYTYLCDISVVGTVTERLCDLTNKAGGTITKVCFYVNDGDDPEGEFPIEVTKLSSGTAARPYPFDGKFSFTAKGVSITEGNNVFRVSAKDDVYGLSGFSLWVCSFEFPYDGEDDVSDPERITEPRIDEGPRWISGGTDGETMVYCFAIPKDQKSMIHQLIVYGEKDLKLELRDDLENHRSIAVWPDTRLPAYFTLRPTMAISNNVLNDVSVIRELTTHPMLQRLSERDQFVYGFGQGLAYEGYDLVFHADAIAIGAARLSAKGRGLAFNIKLVRNVNGNAQAVSPFVSSLEGEPFAMLKGESTPKLFAYFTELFRRSDPRAEEVVLSILTGDYADVGMPELRIGDWRESFYRAMAEMSEVLIMDIKQSPALEHGYFLGRIMADGMRLTVDPKRPDRLDEIGKGEFLIRFSNMPYCKPANRPQYAIDKPIGLLDRVFQIFR